MSLVVVGSIAFDAVKTPFGERTRMLGGSAVHFSLAASFFTDVRVVGPVGEDFGDEQYAVLHDRGINTDDIEKVPGGQTFFWRGRYEYDLNTAHTEDTQLGVFGDFEPKLSEASRTADHLFLANIQPELQLRVRDACNGAKLTGLDSMNLWIDTARDSLEKAISRADLLFLNDAEVRMFASEPNLFRVSRLRRHRGPGRAPSGDDLRVGDRLLQRRVVRDRARQQAHAARDRRALLGVSAHDDARRAPGLEPTSKVAAGPASAG